MASQPRPYPDGRGGGSDRAAERELREEVRRELHRLLDDRQLLRPAPADEERIRALIEERVAAYQHRAAATNRPLLFDPAGVAQRLFDDLLRLGRLQKWLDDPRTEELMLNGPRSFRITEAGKELLELIFEDDQELVELIRRLIGPLGRRLDESSPMVDAPLPDGSRLNAVIPPAAVRWPHVTIRRFILKAQDLGQLVRLGTLSPEAARFLDAVVQACLNLMVGGGTASGKTTMLNCLAASIASPDERVVTCEETAELALSAQLPDCAALQARAANVEGAGEITIRDLVRNALRMRPSRIIVGECRGPEALDVLQAMTTGHPGSMTTIHSSSPREALERMVTLAMMAPERVPREALVEMVAGAIDLVIQLRIDPLSRRRRVVSIFEVTGLEGQTIAGNELWAYDPARDRLVWTGIQPRCLARIRARGIDYTLPPEAGA